MRMLEPPTDGPNGGCMLSKEYIGRYTAKGKLFDCCPFNAIPTSNPFISAAGSMFAEKSVITAMTVTMAGQPELLQSFKHGKRWSNCTLSLMTKELPV